MLGGDGAIPDIDCFMSNSRTVHSEAGKVQLNLEYLFQKIRKFSKNDVNISKNLWSDWNGILLAKFSTNWISKTKIVIMKHQFSSIQLCNDVWLFATPWTAACQASLSITNFQSLLKHMSIESVMPFNHLILCHPLLLLPSILSGGQVGASASVLPMNIQGWFSSGLTGLISLLSKGMSRVFSNTTVQKHQLFSTQSSSGSNPHSYLYITTGKTIASIIQTFVGKVMSAF